MVDSWGRRGGRPTNRTTGRQPASAAPRAARPACYDDSQPSRKRAFPVPSTANATPCRGSWTGSGTADVRRPRCRGDGGPPTNRRPHPGGSRNQPHSTPSFESDATRCFLTKTAKAFHTRGSPQGSSADTVDFTPILVLELLRNAFRLRIEEHRDHIGRVLAVAIASAARSLLSRHHARGPTPPSLCSSPQRTGIRRAKLRLPPIDHLRSPRGGGSCAEFGAGHAGLPPSPLERPHSSS